MTMLMAMLTYKDLVSVYKGILYGEDLMDHLQTKNQSFTEHNRKLAKRRAASKQDATAMFVA